jgi:hypothetical protein
MRLPVGKHYTRKKTTEAGTCKGLYYLGLVKNKEIFCGHGDKDPKVFLV